MHAVEFTTELSGQGIVTIPHDVAAKLPKSGQARVIILTDADSDDSHWRNSAYQQFMRDDDSDEDTVYDTY